MKRTIPKKQSITVSLPKKNTTNNTKINQLQKTINNNNTDKLMHTKKQTNSKENKKKHKSKDKPQNHFKLSKVCFKYFL